MTRRLEKRDRPFNASSKVPEFLVDPAAPHHVGDRQGSGLRKRNIEDTEGFDGIEIRPGCKPAVIRDLLRRPPQDLDVPVDHLLSQGRVGGIATENCAVGDESGLPTRQTDLVAIKRLAPVLHNDVSVLFEDRHDLLLGGDGLVFEHAPLGLTHHSPRQCRVMDQLFANPKRGGTIRQRASTRGAREALRRFRPSNFVLESKSFSASAPILAINLVGSVSSKY